MAAVSHGFVLGELADVANLVPVQLLRAECANHTWTQRAAYRAP